MPETPRLEDILKLIPEMAVLDCRLAVRGRAGDEYLALVESDLNSEELSAHLKVGLAQSQFRVISVVLQDDIRYEVGFLALRPKAAAASG